MRLRSAIIALALVAACSSYAHATIVNIDGTSSTGTTISLGAGTYDVTYAGIAGGGLYDGYSLAMNNGAPVNYTDELSITLGASTNFGNAATYDYLVGGNQQTYATANAALLAYQAALSSGTLSESASYEPQNYTTTVNQIAFTLAAAGSVTFTAPDQYYPDNTGGVSINVAPANSVPEPGSLALLGGGLAAFGLLRRRART